MSTEHQGGHCGEGSHVTDEVPALSFSVGEKDICTNIFIQRQMLKMSLNFIICFIICYMKAEKHIINKNNLCQEFYMNFNIHYYFHIQNKPTMAV